MARGSLGISSVSRRSGSGERRRDELEPSSSCEDAKERTVTTRDASQEFGS